MQSRRLEAQKAMTIDQVSTKDEPVVCIVDDEGPVRASLVDLFESVAMKAIAFESASDFLERCDMGQAGCILLDVRMPGISGLDFQDQLAAAGNTMPIIFMSGHGSIPLTVKAMKAGATDFLIKPFAGSAVIAAVGEAIRRDAENRKEAAIRAQVQSCEARLTPREREVLHYVAAGLMNKQIAHEMQISEIMVKLHRGRMMKKMQAGSLAELVRKFDMLKPDLKLYQ